MSLRKILKEIFSKKYLIEINIDTKQWERKNKTKPESVGVQSWRISDEIDNEFNVFGQFYFNSFFLCFSTSVT